MKPAIKKLRTCSYSKDLVTSAAFGQREQHTNKLVCDHPEMKLNWTEKVCGPCTLYENRNAQLVMPVPQSPQPAVEPSKMTAPAPPKPASPSVTPPFVSPAPATQAESPIKAAPKQARKSAPSEPVAGAVPAKAARKVKPPAKAATTSTDTKVKNLARTKAAKESSQKPVKKSATRPKQK